MTKMEIRKLTESELELCYDALKKSAIESGLEERFVYTKDALQRALFVDKHSDVLTAVVNGKPVGYVMYSVTQRNFTLHPNQGIFIHTLYIDNEYRRQHIGTNLIDELVRISKEKGYGRVEFSLLKTNQIGEKFLNSLNFSEVDFIKPMRLTLV